MGKEVVYRFGVYDGTLRRVRGKSSGMGSGLAYSGDEPRPRGRGDKEIRPLAI